MLQTKFPEIMGILNITPDSFSDGGDFIDPEDAYNHAISLHRAGADIIDIGGESSRPGAVPVSTQQEIDRVVPVIEKLKNEFNHLTVSVDTTKFEVAELAVKAGADIINDISGLEADVRLAELAAGHRKALILMHMQGTPQVMQDAPHYDNVVEGVFNSLEAKIALARQWGVESIIADVGIGFGKTAGQNLILLNNLSRFKDLGVPLLLGISRKSFIGKTLGIETPSERDMATALIHSLLPGFGGDIIRVHNVELIALLKRISGLLAGDS